MNKNKHLLSFCFLILATGLGFTQKSTNISLDGQWSFRTDPYGKGEKAAWFSSNANTLTWDSMPVPGNWDLKNEYADYAGDAWYTRTFMVDKSLSTSQFRILFESVYHHATIWINGKPVGNNYFGFLPFGFDVSKYLIFGAKNRVTLKVNNVHKRGALWNWGGIRRSVTLEITPTTRIEFQHIDAVPDLTTGVARITNKIICSNKTSTAKRVKIGIKVVREGRIVIEDDIQTSIPPKTLSHEVTWTQELSRSKVDLWHVDFPNLYESQISLSEGSQTLHTLSDRFGIRKLEIDGLNLLLNGESIRPVGFNLVPEDRFTGNTLPLHRIKEDVDLMKRCGANFARLSHVPLPKAFLDYLDEKGIMVFEEVGLWGKDDMVDPDNPLPKEMLERMIEEKYNHPSIVGWSVGNEIGDEEKNPKVNAYVKGAIQRAKTLDPNRLAIYASNTAQKSAEDATQYADLAMVNVYGGWGKGADQAWNFHKKPVFISEFGDALNSDDPNLGTVPIEKMMNQLRNKAYVIGTSLWTFNDYRSTYHGMPGWVTPPSQNRSWGIVTSFRDKKRSFYDVQRAYAPVKGMAFSNLNLSSDSLQVIITPRTKLDIPANILRGYSLQITFMGQKFNKIEEVKIKLKDIYPGDDAFAHSTFWSNKAQTRVLQVELIDPQGYSVLEESKYFKVPDQPTITHSITANNAVRIQFDKLPDAEEYFVKYSKSDSTFMSAKTINTHIDIEDGRIKQGEPWTYQVIAVNNAGESLPSSVLNAKRDEGELPPVVWGNKRVLDDIFVAYSVSPYDYLYEIEMGSQSGIYTEKFTTKLKGVLNLKSLDKGKPLFFRMRVIKQWGFPSKWTHETKAEIK